MPPQIANERTEAELRRCAAHAGIYTMGRILRSRQLAGKPFGLDADLGIRSIATVP